MAVINYNWSPGSASSWGSGLLTAGSSSYSTPPTVSEIQSGSGLNQMAAAANFMQWYRGSTYYVPYLNTSTLLTTKFFETNSSFGVDAIKEIINSVRSGSGQSAYSWTPSTITTGTLIIDDIIAELRDALETTWLYNSNPFSSTSDQALIKELATWPVDADTPAITSGDAIVSKSTNYRVRRKFLTFNFASGKTPSGSNNVMQIYCSAYAGAGPYNINVDLGTWSGSLSTGDWAAYSSVLGSAYVSSTTTKYIDVSLGSVSSTIKLCCRLDTDDSATPPPSSTTSGFDFNLLKLIIKG